MKTKLINFMLVVLLLATAHLCVTAQAQRARTSPTQRKTERPPEFNPAESKFSFWQEPQLGMKLPGTEPLYFHGAIVGAGEPDPSHPGVWLSGGTPVPRYDLEYQGIMYMISTLNKDWAINFIATTDPMFKTPEGLRVGDSARRTLKLSHGKAVKENNYVFYVRLKSGWNAEFLQADYDANGKLIVNTDGKLRPDTKIQSFYKK